MNKAELLANVRAGRLQLDVSLARLSEEQMLVPALHAPRSLEDGSISSAPSGLAFRITIPLR